MAWSDKIKLNKQLIRSVADAGYESPTTLQQKIMARMIGGQDFVAIAPEGGGKTTAYVLAVLNRFNHQPDGVPKVLILTPNQEGVEAIIDRFDTLNRNRTIQIVGLYAMPGIESQMDALADGADIVVATPDRARAIYLKLGLNLNKIEVYIVDDADLIVKQGLQLPTNELANSITKAQRLVFTQVMHAKLEKLIEPFMPEPVIIEVEEIGETTLNLYPQVLYQVPNFGTKINLLNLFMQDSELFTKTVVFVNTRQTAEKLYKSLTISSKSLIAVYNSWNPTWVSFASAQDFTADSDVRMLIVANENADEIDLSGVPFLLHFDLPAEKDLYLDRLVNTSADSDEEILGITFATDLELTDVRKIEQASGQKIPVMELPDGLVIEKERKRTEDKSTSSTEGSDPTKGAAFHEKKAKNAKTYNFSSGQKAKMNMKKKHG